MSDDRSESLANFAAITGADASRAQHFLESSGWNLELAVANFYQEGEDDDDDDNPVITHEENPNRSAAANVSPPPAKAKGGATNSRFGTISSLRASSDSDSSEDREAYYAGGSEHGGGQQVMGPKKKKPEKFVEEMFEAARERGAEDVPAGSETEARKTKSNTFVGSGYRLGNTGNSSQVVEGAQRSEEPRDMQVVLRLWKNGFSVSDGPLREYSDPANQEFLDSIKQGEIPRELQREARGGEVHLDMEDHRTEAYEPPKPKLKPFGGEGHRLGSAAPTVITNTPQGEHGESSAKSQLNVDKTKPATSVQVRLADSTRLVVQLNLGHTVGDIRNYITTARPEMGRMNFALMTTFPNKELTDLAETVEQAKLSNAVIVQRMK